MWLLTNRQPAAVNVSFSEADRVYEARYDLTTARLLTFQVHSGLKTFPEAAGWAVLSADLINDAVVPPCTQVVVLACERQRKMRKGRKVPKTGFIHLLEKSSHHALDLEEVEIILFDSQKAESPA